MRVVGPGKAVVLRGVNLSGAEYACLTGGFWDQPKGTQATIGHMRVGWHANVVRLPLNEGCWLGLSGHKGYRGGRYRGVIARFVRRATSSGLVVEVDLHFGIDRTSDNYPALDAAHAASFWRSVALRFKDDPSVIFNLINEPHGISWQCYRDGCPAGEGPGYAVVGTQAVVEAIRATGATNPIIVAGLDWSDDLGKWPQWHPERSRRPADRGIRSVLRLREPLREAPSEMLEPRGGADPDSLRIPGHRERDGRGPRQVRGHAHQGLHALGRRAEAADRLLGVDFHGRKLQSGTFADLGRQGNPNRLVRRSLQEPPSCGPVGKDVETSPNGARAWITLRCSSRNIAAPSQSLTGRSATVSSLVVGESGAPDGTMTHSNHLEEAGGGARWARSRSGRASLRGWR